MKKIILTFICLTLFKVTAQNFANLDNSFGANGIYLVPFLPPYTNGIKALSLPGNETIVIFNSPLNSHILKLNSSGSIDPSFGVSGTNTVFPSPSFQVNSLDAQISSNNKIYLCGAIDQTAAVTVFNSNGTIDNTWGINGNLLLNSYNFALRTLAFQSDGKIVLGAQGTNGSAVFMRLNSNGSFDNSFGVNGVNSITLTPSEFQIEINDVKVQSDGKILFFGHKEYITPQITVSYAVRLNTNGTLDTGFGTNGIAETSTALNYIDVTANGHLLSNGKYLLTGYRHANLSKTTANFMALRLNNNGSIDPSYGTNGFFEMDCGAIDRSWGSYMQNDEKVILTGNSYNPQSLPVDSGYFVLARFNTNGSADLSFGTNSGYRKFQVPTYHKSVSHRVTMQSDGKIITTGTAGTCTAGICTGTMFVSRHNNTGGEPLNIKHNSTLKEISAFPIPANQDVFIESDINETVHYTLINTAGIKCKEFTFKMSGNINVSDLSEGVYFLEGKNESLVLKPIKIIISK